MENDIAVLPDWMTTPEVRLGTKITSDNSDCGGVHMHAFYEIFYIIEGNTTHIINGQYEQLQPGDVLFLRLFDIHGFEREPNATCSHRDIVVAPEQYEKCCDYIDKGLLNSIKSSIRPPKITLSIDQISLFEQKFTNFINIPPSRIETKSSIANILLVELLGSLVYARQTDTTPKYPAWFEQLLSRFNMSSCIKNGLDEIIKLTNYDRSYICRTFKKNMGVTMSRYLCMMRLHYSTLLLKTTDKTIAEIANDIGFSSISFFNKQFKLQFNLTPKEYRKLSKNKDKE